jgi:glycosyltransferase involved in cell wall biosynthesis
LGTSSSTAEPRRPRVLIVVENLSVPSDRRVWQESLALQRAGYDVHVICPAGEDRDRELYEHREGVEIHRFPLRAASGGPIGYIGEYGEAFWRIRGLARRLAGRRGFDVVQACNPPDLLLLAVRSLKRRGARFIFDHHDLVPELYVSRFGRRRDVLYRVLCVLERRTFRLADVVLSTNGSYKQVAVERGGVAEDQVFVVRNAPDPSRFQTVAPDESLKRGRQHLLAYVGVIAPQDGVDYALRALALLRDRRSDWHAIFLGAGDALGRMKHLATQLGLDGHVEFGGWADDSRILSVLSTADVCLAPDPKSPLNDRSTMIKVIEYMAMGRAIVSFDLAESRVTAGDAAVYAPANNEGAFAGRIEELLDHPELRMRLGEIGRARVEGPLAWRHSEAALLAAYRLALTGHLESFTPLEPKSL